MKVLQDHEELLNLPPTIDSHEDALSLFNRLADQASSDPAFAQALSIKKVGNPITVRTVKDAATWTRQQIEGVRGAREKYLDGIQNPSRDPKAAALEAKDRWRNSVEEAAKDDAYAKGIQGYNQDEAVATAVAIGADNLVRGVEAREAKISRTVQKLQPLIAAVKTTVDRIPVKTAADAEKKMVENLRLMREVGKKMRG